MSATGKLLEEMLDTIIAKAPQARHAGIRRVHVEGLLSFDLAPTEPPAAQDDDERDEEESESADPFEDAATYGGRVPGFRRRHEEH
jgi:hypothetical protein